MQSPDRGHVAKLQPSMWTRPALFHSVRDKQLPCLLAVEAGGKALSFDWFERGAKARLFAGKGSNIECGRLGGQGGFELVSIQPADFRKGCDQNEKFPFSCCLCSIDSALL